MEGEYIRRLVVLVEDEMHYHITLGIEDDKLKVIQNFLKRDDFSLDFTVTPNDLDAEVALKQLILNLLYVTKNWKWPS
jgi:uncharacterized protein YpuA (DUF1002 family)